MQYPTLIDTTCLYGSQWITPPSSEPHSQDPFSFLLNQTGHSPCELSPVTTAELAIMLMRESRCTSLMIMTLSVTALWLKVSAQSPTKYAVWRCEYASRYTLPVTFISQRAGYVRCAHSPLALPRPRTAAHGAHYQSCTGFTVSHHTQEGTCLLEKRTGRMFSLCYVGCCQGRRSCSGRGGHGRCTFLLLIKYSLPLLVAWAWPRVCALGAILTDHANSSFPKENSVCKWKWSGRSIGSTMELAETGSKSTSEELKI